MDKKLVMNDLADLQIGLHHISSRWYDLGVQLRIDVGDLDNIKKNNPVVNECLREMLKIWLKQVAPYPTWNALINVLKCPVINEQQLANKLQTKCTTDVVTPPIQSVSGSYVDFCFHCLVHA